MRYALFPVDADVAEALDGATGVLCACVGEHLTVTVLENGRAQVEDAPGLRKGHLRRRLGPKQEFAARHIDKPLMKRTAVDELKPGARALDIAARGDPHEFPQSTGRIGDVFYDMGCIDEVERLVRKGQRLDIRDNQGPAVVYDRAGRVFVPYLIPGRMASRHAVCQYGREGKRRIAAADVQYVPSAADQGLDLGTA